MSAASLIGAERWMRLLRMELAECEAKLHEVASEERLLYRRLGEIRKQRKCLEEHREQIWEAIDGAEAEPFLKLQRQY